MRKYRKMHKTRKFAMGYMSSLKAGARIRTSEIIRAIKAAVPTATEHAAHCMASNLTREMMEDGELVRVARGVYSLKPQAAEQRPIFELPAPTPTPTPTPAHAPDALNMSGRQIAEAFIDYINNLKARLIIAEGRKNPTVLQKIAEGQVRHKEREIENLKDKHQVLQDENTILKRRILELEQNNRALEAGARKFDLTEFIGGHNEGTFLLPKSNEEAKGGGPCGGNQEPN